jgi:transposase
VFYADETGVSEQGYVPYGWQFKEEQVYIEVGRGKAINCFALLARDNRVIYTTTNQTITADFIMEQLEELSIKITKPTVVVLDNAKVHTAAKLKACLAVWQNRGLYLFYLPPYSPHLNIAERLWKELKARWIRPQDYKTIDTLSYAVTLALSAVGTDLFIHFSEFNL